MVAEKIGECFIAAVTKQGLRVLIDSKAWKADFDLNKVLDDLGEDLLVSFLIAGGFRIIKKVINNPDVRRTASAAGEALFVSGVAAGLVLMSPALVLGALFGTPSSGDDEEPQRYGPLTLEDMGF